MIQSHIIEHILSLESCCIHDEYSQNNVSKPDPQACTSEQKWRKTYTFLKHCIYWSLYRFCIDSDPNIYSYISINISYGQCYDFDFGFQTCGCLQGCRHWGRLCVTPSLNLYLIRQYTHANIAMADPIPDY